MKLFYTFFIKLYVLGIRLTSLYNDKAKKWIEGRRDQAESWPPEQADKTRWIWLHAASLGEFEQGRPLIEAFKQTYPDQKILLTFFSPSGYEIRKDYPLADQIAYLPADTPKNVSRFLDGLSISLAVFIKYEFWFNYISQLLQRNIPLIFVSSRFTPNQFFFSSYGKWFLNKLQGVSYFYVQDRSSEELLRQHGISQVMVTGDTRFDRVVSLAQKAASFPKIEAFINGRKVLIFGSTWPEDETHLFEAMKQVPDEYCILLAPHETHEKRIRSIESTLTLSHQRYSSSSLSSDSRILIIDTIGILSQLYQYADFAFVGGGFGKSIHNIQEPVAFGCPVIIGPHYSKFIEAVELIQAGGVRAIANGAQLADAINDFIYKPDLLNRASAICIEYARQNTGATQSIMTSIEDLINS